MVALIVGTAIYIGIFIGAAFFTNEYSTRGVQDPKIKAEYRK
jgi:hypothetical protein